MNHSQQLELSLGKWTELICIPNRFKAGDFNLEDQERPNRPSTTDEDQIKTLIENNPRYMTRKLAEMLNMSKSTIHKQFVKLGYINRFDVWVPHDLTEKNLMDCISICNIARSINATRRHHF